MKGFKAFEKGLVCRGKQYSENTVFEEEKAELCKSGMHFCQNPLDVLNYYPLIDGDGNLTEFAEVEALGDVKTEGDKSVTNKLKIGAKLSLAGFAKASFDVLYESIKSTATNLRTKNSDALAKAGGDNSKLAGGDGSTLAGGDYSQLAGGDSSKLAGGDSSTLAGGYNSTLAGGDGSTLAGGDGSTLAGGYNSTLAGGYSSKLAGGDSSTLAGGNYSKLAGGNYSKLAGGCGSIMVGDNGSVAKGKKGSLIVLVEREYIDSKWVIKSFKAELVDGERIKEDTFYRLENGEFVEIQ